jgi:hypothetical protein
MPLGSLGPEPATVGGDGTGGDGGGGGGGGGGSGVDGDAALEVDWALEPALARLRARYRRPVASSREQRARHYRYTPTAAELAADALAAGVFEDGAVSAGEATS